MHLRMSDESYVPICKGSDQKKLSQASLGGSRRAGLSRTHASGRKRTWQSDVPILIRYKTSHRAPMDVRTVKIGDSWVHLRLCLTCGHVGCCDSSKNKHATRHFHATNHPLIQSFQPGEDWVWCYIDQVMLEPA